jgi:hypothetical protein
VVSDATHLVSAKKADPRPLSGGWPHFKNVRMLLFQIIKRCENSYIIL